MRLWSLLPIILALNNLNAADAIASTGTPPIILTPDFVEAVQQAVDADGIPGLTLAVVYKNGPPELGAWGVKDEDGTNMTIDTLFNIASCSKAFLSASLGILIDDFAHGRNTTPLPAGLSTLSWKTKVIDILPNDWKLQDPWASKKANMIDILSHVSGLSSHDLSYKPNDSVADVTRNLRNLRPSVELREEWLYNNQMYMVGSYVVSTLSGMRFADFVSSRIFKPLSMDSSTYSIDAAVNTGRFTSTWTSFGRLIPHWLQEEFADLVAGPGGVISSVEELVPWVRMLLNGGVDPGTNATIIPPVEFDVITSAHSIMSPNTGGPVGLSTQLYGLGWMIYSIVGHDVIMHYGGVPGVSALVAAAPNDGIGFIALANADAKQPSMTNIALLAARKALGSETGNYTSSSPTNASTPLRANPRRHGRTTSQAESTAALPSIDIAGTYFNAGYGRAVLCSVHSSSSYCQNVLNDFRSVDKSLSSNSTDLFVSWITTFDSHFRFTHSNDTQYIISAGTIYPEGYGKNSTPFSTLTPGGLATFVVENESVVGFGISGITGVERPGPVEEAYDVWFVREASSNPFCERVRFVVNFLSTVSPFTTFLPC